jgi:acyl carrier protein
LRMTNERPVAGDPVDRSAISATVVATIESLMQDWDIEEPIRPATRVVADLGFESIDLIQMVGALERAFRLSGMSLVDMLVVDGRYVDDLSIGQITDAVAVRLEQRAER